MENNKFTFYESYLKMLEPLETVEEKLELLLSVIKYALYDEQPNIQGALLSAFLATKPNIDNDLKRRAILKANGSAGGRPKKEEEKPNETKENQSITKENQTKPEHNQNGYDARAQETETETKTEKEKEKETLTKVSGSLVNNIINIISCNARPRAKLEMLLKNETFFNYFFEFRQYYGEHVTDFEEQANFVVEVLAEMIIQSNKPECFKFKKQTFNFEKLWELLQHFDEDCLRSVVSSLQYREDIKNKTLYAKGAILEQAEQSKKLGEN